jgi:thioredoxin:protein disulfide reductase
VNNNNFLCKLGRLAKQAALVTTAALMLLPTVSTAAEDYLDPELAFKLSTQPIDAKTIELRFDVAPGYHLYREKLNVQAEPGTVQLGALQVPPGKVVYDPTFQKDVEIFDKPVTLRLPVEQAGTAPYKLIVGNQGCADKGLCYPPMQRAFRVEPGAAGMQLTALSEAQAEAWQPGLATTAAAAAPAVAAATAATPAAAPEESGQFASALKSRSLLTVAGVFLVAGLLLSFTPCVLPMIPILSSIIVGQSGTVSKAKGFSLALAYSLGMAMVYTAFGMVAGLMGEGLAAALQNAWVLGGFALLLITLSLSMFGVYELQLPSGIQNRMNEASGRLKGGQHVGVFVMGGMSALVVGPCVAAPLAGALVYISQTKDVILGGVALFALASGMSVPLLLVGVSAGSLLPRAGGWMEKVKHFFGVMLLGVALWMVSPVLPSWGLMVGVATLLLVTAVYLGAFERLSEVTPGRTFTKGVGLVFGVMAMLQLAGVASGGRDLTQPLRHLVQAGSGTAVAAERDELKFATVANLQALDAAVQASAKPVMVDFYADWCVACKEFESLTFSDPAVRKKLGGFTLLRVDVTANNPQDKALMKKYSLFGPPALLFFKSAGPELSTARVVGFQNASDFLGHLNQLPEVDGMKLSAR